MNLRRRIMSPSLAALRLQCTPRQTGYGGRIRTYVNEFQKLAPFQLGHSVRFLNWWTWHDLNVRPRPSQSRALIPLSYRSGISGGERAALTATSAVARSHHRNLAEATGLEPAYAMRGDLANRCHTIRRRLHRLAEGTGLEPASDKCAVVFGTTALPVRLPFQEILICEFEIRLAGTPGFEPRISGLESDGLPLAYAPKEFLVHVVGLAPTKDNQVRLIYSQVLLLLSHTCTFGIQISNLACKISSLRSICVKK